MQFFQPEPQLHQRRRPATLGSLQLGARVPGEQTDGERGISGQAHLGQPAPGTVEVATPHQDASSMKADRRGAPVQPLTEELGNEFLGPIYQLLRAATEIDLRRERRGLRPDSPVL